MLKKLDRHESFLDCKNEQAGGRGDVESPARVTPSDCKNKKIKK